MDLYSQHVTSTKTPHGFVNPFSGEEMPRQVALVTPERGSGPSGPGGPPGRPPSSRAGS